MLLVRLRTGRPPILGRPGNDWDLLEPVVEASDGNFYSVADTGDPYFATTSDFAVAQGQTSTDGALGDVDPGQTAYYYELVAIPVDTKPVAIEADQWIRAEDDTSGLSSAVASP